jgi:uncharacterized protein (UPF0261 family)
VQPSPAATAVSSAPKAAAPASASTGPATGMTVFGTTS